MTAYTIAGGTLSPALVDAAAFVTYRGDPESPSAILLKHNGLHIELAIDRGSAVGRGNPAGLADITLESDLTAIIDFENSVAAVDADDKVGAYANWLGLMKGDLRPVSEKAAPCSPAPSNPIAPTSPPMARR